MNFQQKKITYVFLPFILLIFSFSVLNIMSEIKPSPLDTLWTTRQLIIGLFIFVSLSFIPSFAKLSFSFSYPWISVNLSHHTDNQKAHELVIREKSICVGCFGSSMSILLANCCLLLYFYLPSIFRTVTASKFFTIGIILIMVTYSRYFTDFVASVRLIQHSSLFLGISFLIIAEDMVFQSALFIVLLLPSWITFLLARVKLSEISHF